MKKYSFTEENYLKAIYFLSKASKKGVSTTAIANSLETKPASVTDMLKKLSEKKLLHYQKYKGAQLTEKGEQVAIGTIRKHRLWECFLVDKLEFGWDEVHEVAEQLEHIQSPKLTDSLDSFLGFPKFDPHGDPIPDKEGVFPQRSNQTLDHFKAGDTVTVKGIKDTSPEFLKYLDKLQVDLGTSIEVMDVEDFDHSMTVKLHNKTLSLSALTCNNIYVK
jgi:DtxR family Mn-dependent transcriptional regulator